MDLCGNRLLQNDTTNTFCKTKARMSTNALDHTADNHSGRRGSPTDIQTDSRWPSHRKSLCNTQCGNADLFHRLSSDEPEQLLQRHPTAGSSWPSWSQASHTRGADSGISLVCKAVGSLYPAPPCTLTPKP